MHKNRRIAKKAAQWWADQIGKTDADNGTLLGSMLSCQLREKVSKDNLPKAQSFCTALEGWIFACEPSTILVDYNLDETLLGALKESSIMPNGALPVKTVMRINWDTEEINVRCGYGSKWVCLQEASTLNCPTD